MIYEDGKIIPEFECFGEYQAGLAQIEISLYEETGGGVSVISPYSVAEREGIDEALVEASVTIFNRLLLHEGSDGNCKWGSTTDLALVSLKSTLSNSRLHPDVKENYRRLIDVFETRAAEQNVLDDVEVIQRRKLHLVRLPLSKNEIERPIAIFLEEQEEYINDYE